MASPRQFGIVALLFALILAGCSSVGTQQTSQTKVSTVSEVTTTTPDSDKPPSCQAEQQKYEVAMPEEPNILNETTAERIAVEYEKRYQRARHEAIYNLSHYESSVAQVDVNNTKNRFEVTVKLRVDVETGDGNELSGGYPHTYVFTDDGIVRDEENIVCWKSV